ncbi:uncharacterized protein LOC118757410 [Rhagoletis pomonella]|uniref:uncharacterized protein LOC118757410 n=1 Tax=Rhagoletis pomonella TaxID=28610 RepID=UPI00177AB91F|nr:uncharacterized protein LOC118757410 [Rhagoletis pomonella]
MKGLIITASVLFLVAIASAADVPLPIINYEGTVNNIIKEAQDEALRTAEALQVQYKVIVVEPLQQVDTAVIKIEDRRQENDNCVAAKDQEVELVVDTFHEELNVCGIIAAKTSVEIMNDVNSATQQLVFDGYDVLKLYQKCQNYKNIVLKNSCYAKLSIKATLYLKNARRSIKTIKGANKRVSAVFTQSDACTNNAAEKAVTDLDLISVDVETCITKTQFI